MKQIIKDALNKDFSVNPSIQKVIDLQIDKQSLLSHRLELNLNNPLDRNIAANFGIANLANILKTLNNYSESQPESLKKIFIIYQRLQIIKRNFNHIASINPEMGEKLVEWESFIKELLTELKKNPKIFYHVHSKQFVNDVVLDKTKYEERFNKLIKSKRGQELISHYLLPENIKSLSQEALFEYLTTVTKISREILLNKISKPSKGKIIFGIDKEGRVKSQSTVELELDAIDIEKISSEIKDIYSRARKLKLPEEYHLLERMDREVYQILGDLVNRLIRDFPYPLYKTNRYEGTKDEIYNIMDWDFKNASSIKNVLENSRALCNGQVTMLSLLCEKLNLKNYACTVEGHIYSEIELPSKRRLLIYPINHMDINDPKTNLGHFEVIEEVFPHPNDSLNDGTKFFNWEILTAEEKKGYMLRIEPTGTKRYFKPVHSANRNQTSDQTYQYFNVFDCREVKDIIDSAYVSFGNYATNIVGEISKKLKNRGVSSNSNEILSFQESALFLPLNQNSEKKLNFILKNLMKEYIKQPEEKKLISILFILIKLNRINEIRLFIQNKTNNHLLKNVQTHLNQIIKHKFNNLGQASKEHIQSIRETYLTEMINIYNLIENITA